MTDWKPVPLTPRLVSLLGANTQAYQKDLSAITDLNCFVTNHGADGGWHLSISHRQVDRSGQTRPGRYPTWEEIKEARYRFCPDDITMAMLLPPTEEFVNLHDTTFHLYQVDDSAIPKLQTDARPEAH